MFQLGISDSFEYLCYGSRANINICTFTVRGSTLESNVYRRQILTIKVDPRYVGLGWAEFPYSLDVKYSYM